MFRFRRLAASAALLTGLLLIPSAGRAAMFTGTLYYTNFNGGENVHSVNYSYDDVTKDLALSAPKGIAALGGADGIIFDGAGHLLVGGQGTGNVYRLNPDGTNIQHVLSGSGQSYHLALGPSGAQVYTSAFGGALDIVPLSPFANGTSHNVSGSDNGVTQLAFAAGKSFYDNSQPNGNGTFGTIDLNTFTTTRILNSELSIHGMVYDPFTGLITFFGAGAVGTVDPSLATNALIAASFKQRTGINFDFDQGAVDGHGHALIAGNGEITFIDYSQTGDITSPLNKVIIEGGFGGIDDVAPLVGLGAANVAPEPSALVLLATGAFGLFGYGWRRRRSA
jgi:hypothetical protein